MAAALLAAVLGVILLRPGGPTLSDDTEHVQAHRVLPFLSSGQTITQAFEAQEDDLTQVMMRFAVGDGVDGCQVRVRVRSVSRTVGERSADCAQLRQAELWTVSFDPEGGSEGDEYQLEVHLTGMSSGPMSVWGGPSLGTLPPAELDGKALPISAELHTAYGDDRLAAQQVGKALDRIDGYGPFWHHPAFVILVALVALGCLVALAGSAGRLGLVLLVCFAASKGLLWSTVVPPMEGPDEKAHFAYAQFMAEQRRIPRRGEDQLGIHRAYSEVVELGVDRVYHQTSQWPGNRPDFSDEGRRRAEQVLSGAAIDAGGSSAAAGYSPYYYAPAAALYLIAPADLDQQVGAMRLWSVGLGVAAAWLAVLIGRRLFPGSPRAALALGVACAAQPMLSQQMAIINNDGMVIVAGFACLLVALELAQPSPHRRLPFLGGLAVGMAVATKPFGIAWAPVLVAGWAVGRMRTPASDRRPWIGDVVRAGAGAAATYGAWLVTSILLDLPATAVQTFNPEPGPRTLKNFIDLHTRNAFKPLRDRWIDQFWGNFGGLTLPMPQWVQALLTTAAVLTVAALAAWLVVTAVRVARARAAALEDDEVDAIVHTGLCAFAVLVTLGVLHAADFLQYRENGRLELLQGRYALMVVPAALALPALFVKRFAPKVSVAAVVATTAAAVVALNMLGLTLIVERYYL